MSDVGGLMKFNGSCGGGNTLSQIEGDVAVWKSIAEKLWALLDDVDTAGDMFKPPINGFFKYVVRKAEQRHRYLRSDGYSLVLTSECVENIASDTKESSQTATNK